MSDAISREEVAKVARLARLRLSDDELETFTEQLGQILEHARDVNALDLDDLEDSLILEEISEQVTALKADAKDLTEVAGRIKAIDGALAKEAALVEDAAKAINGLVQVVTAAASAGLI